MPAAGRGEQGPGRAPPGGSCRSRSRFSRFRGAHDRGAYATACLRVPAGPPSQPKASEAGGRERAGSPESTPRLVARWGFGGGRWRVPPWRGCARVAPVPGCPVPFYPPPELRRRHPGLGNWQWRDGVIWGQRLGTTLVPAARAGLCPPEPVAPWQLAQGWDPGPCGYGEIAMGPGGAPCAGGCMCMHVCMYVCVRVHTHHHPPVLVPACPAGLGRRHPPGFAAISASSLDLILPCLWLACN